VGVPDLLEEALGLVGHGYCSCFRSFEYANTVFIRLVAPCGFTWRDRSGIFGRFGPAGLSSPAAPKLASLDRLAMGQRLKRIRSLAKSSPASRVVCFEGRVIE
jgi:hypothetical protein